MVWLVSVQKGPTIWVLVRGYDLITDTLNVEILADYFEGYYCGVTGAHVIATTEAIVGNGNHLQTRFYAYSIWRWTLHLHRELSGSTTKPNR